MPDESKETTINFPIKIRDLAAGVIALVVTGAGLAGSGIVHLSSADAVSQYRDVRADVDENSETIETVKGEISDIKATVNDNQRSLRDLDRSVVYIRCYLTADNDVERSKCGLKTRTR